MVSFPAIKDTRTRKPLFYTPQRDWLPFHEWPEALVKRALQLSGKLLTLKMSRITSGFLRLTLC